MAEFSCLIDQSRHHDAMSFQQVTDRERIKLRKKIVSGDGISDLLNFPEGSNDFFPVQNIGDLILGKRIPFDCQRRLDRFDFIRFTQFQSIMLFQTNSVTFNERGNLRNHRDRFGRYCKWRLVCHNQYFFFAQQHRFSAYYSRWGAAAIYGLPSLL